ncbi:MAG: methionyl-tRNA formyltransferase [Chloroherpetonaceae bacterium]|nr:methionyl-tRNA formyltransferase [Chloroherpetonaceae bacterium]
MSLRTVFMGTPEFAVPSLRKIVASGYEVPLVVTSPDKPRQSAKSQAEPTPVKKTAQELGLSVLEVEDLSSPEFEAALRRVEPDAIAVVAFRILPPHIFSIPKKGIFNLHASLLPKYRGAAPINWAIINGEKETGVTTFFLQEKVDTGEMIVQKRLEIFPDEVATELAARLAVLGAEAVVETLELIQQGTVKTIPQDHSQATKAPKLTKENTQINWNEPAQKVHQFICGLSERPAAWTTLEGKLVKLYRSRLVETHEKGEAGRWHISGNTLYVWCGEGMIEVLSLQFEGKKRLRTSDFLHGYRIKGNEKFAWSNTP